MRRIRFTIEPLVPDKDCYKCTLSDANVEYCDLYGKLEEYPHPQCIKDTINDEVQDGTK